MMNVSIMRLRIMLKHAHRKAISRDFPILYQTIACEMKNWYEQQPLSLAFIEVKPELVDDLLALADEAAVNCAELTFDELLKEMKWKDRSQRIDEVEMVIGPDGKITPLS